MRKTGMGDIHMEEDEGNGTRKLGGSRDLDTKD